MTKSITISANLSISNSLNFFLKLKMLGRETLFVINQKEKEIIMNREAGSGKFGLLDYLCTSLFIITWWLLRGNFVI